MDNAEMDHQEYGPDVAVTARECFCVSAGHDCRPGDLMRLPASRVRRLLAQGRVQLTEKEVAR